MSATSFTLQVPTATSSIDLFEKTTTLKMDSIESISIKAFSNMIPTLIYSVFSTDLETKGIACNKTDLLIRSIFIDIKMAVFSPELTTSSTRASTKSASAGAASGGAGTEMASSEAHHPDAYLKTFVWSYSNKYRMPADYQELFKDSEENRFAYFLQALIKKTSTCPDITESSDFSSHVDKIICNLIAAKTEEEGNEACLPIKNYLSKECFISPEKDPPAEIEKIFLAFLVNRVSLNLCLLKFLLKKHQENPSLTHLKSIVSLLIQPKLEEFEDPLAFCASQIHGLIDKIGSEHALNMKSFRESPRAISLPISTIVGAKITIKYNEHGVFYYKII